MRRLLLVVLGVAGLQLAELPAAAQMAQDSTDFSGAIPATCLIRDLPETIQLNLQPVISLVGAANFVVRTNSSAIRMDISDLSVEQEPTPTGSAIRRNQYLHHLSNGMWVEVAQRLGPISSALQVSTSSDNGFSIGLSIYTVDRVDGKYQLAPGDYSYTLTISCLLP